MYIMRNSILNREDKVTPVMSIASAFGFYIIGAGTEYISSYLFNSASVAFCVTFLLSIVTISFADVNNIFRLRKARNFSVVIAAILLGFSFLSVVILYGFLW